MLKEPLSPDSLNSSFNFSSAMSQSWAGGSMYAMSAYNNRPPAMRPLSLSNSFTSGFAHTNYWQSSASLNSSYGNSNSTNNLATLLANTSIQGLTDEHISKLLLPTQSNSNAKQSANEPKNDANELTQTFRHVLPIISEFN